MKDFLSGAKNLANSPLGIIALFISLIYGFACLVLSVASKNLTEYERIPLIWFMILFPIIILFSFLYLVTKHHRKLYGPSDFKDEKIFLETIDIKSQSERILTISNDSSDIEEPEQGNNKEQRINRLNNFLVSENLALRLIEKEYSLPFRRNIKFPGYKGTFDGVMENKTMFVGVDIKYYSDIEERYSEVLALNFTRKFRAFMRIAEKHVPLKTVVFELVIVYEHNIDAFRNSLRERLKAEQNLNVRFIDFSSLKSTFGLD